MFRALVLVAALGVPFAAAAEEGWTPLDGAAIRAALEGRILSYPNGATQSFTASGETAYDSGHVQPGRWRVEGDQYCSVWPPSDQWACYDMAKSADGRLVRFIAGDGSVTDGADVTP